MFWRGKWKCLYISKSLAVVWHRLSRCVQQDGTGSHDEKKNDFRNPSMFLFVRSLRVHKNDRSCTWCSRKWSLISHDSNFHSFFLAPFSSISWILEQALIFRLDWVSYGTALCKGLWSPCPPCPNSVWYNFPLRWTWNCQNTEHIFCHFFFLIDRINCCY